MPKRITPLSDIQVKNAKPQEKDYKLMDGYGLFLLVSSTNGMLWRFDYRYCDKRKVMPLGAYPAVSLAEPGSTVKTRRSCLPMRRNKESTEGGTGRTGHQNI